MTSLDNVLTYYQTHGRVTDLAGVRVDFSETSAEIPDLVKLTQNLLIHIHIAEWVYGIKLSEERRAESNIRKVAEIMETFLLLGDSSSLETRDHEQHVAGTCRDFAVVMAALLRQKGIPARARCGFATYFSKKFEDHWITEYWNVTQNRWVMVDPQIDDAQRKKMNIKANTLDLAKNDFVNGAEAWQMCRRGEADPNEFGIFDMKGLWFVRGNLIRDFASLNKVELLPWDIWGLIAGADEEISTDDLAFLDEIAELMLAGESQFDELQSVFASDDRMKPGDTIQSFMNGAMHTVKLQI